MNRFLLSFLILLSLAKSSLLYGGVAEGISLFEEKKYSSAFNEFLLPAKSGDEAAQIYLGYLYMVGFEGVPVNYKESFKWYKKAADQGHPSAMFMVGRSYESGIGVIQDQSEAENWYLKAAELGNVNALLSLGNLYSSRGTQEYEKKGFEFYLDAAEQGNAEAQSKVSGHYFKKALLDPTNENQDFRDSLKWGLLAAEQGYAKAQMTLGMLYAYGFGDIRQDLKESERWLLAAANQGDSSAQSLLGSLYVDRSLGMQNLEKAFYWHSKAAEQGESESQLSMSKFYRYGVVVEQDAITAHMWANIAASNGEDMAERDSISKMLSSDQLREAQRLASEWVKSHKGG